MCDYSLHNVATRPAKVGDKLVTTSFHNSSTRGFTAIGDPNVAVCLLPGTELALEKEVECDHVFPRLLPSLRFEKIEETVARFRQVNIGNPHVHHDALEFPKGQILLINGLCEGQHATVLQLPASTRATSEVEEQERSSVVA
jgi:hypothetical protein